MIKLHLPTNPIDKTAWYNPLQNLTHSLSSFKSVLKLLELSWE